MFHVTDYAVASLSMSLILSNVAMLKLFPGPYLAQDHHFQTGVEAFHTIHRLRAVALGRKYPSKPSVPDCHVDKLSTFLTLSNVAIIGFFPKMHDAPHFRFLPGVGAFLSIQRHKNVVLVK